MFSIRMEGVCTQCERTFPFPLLPRLSKRLDALLTFLPQISPTWTDSVHVMLVCNLFMACCESRFSQHCFPPFLNSPPSRQHPSRHTSYIAVIMSVSINSSARSKYSSVADREEESLFNSKPSGLPARTVTHLDRDFYFSRPLSSSF